MIITRNELSRLQKKYKFMGIVSLPPLYGSDVAIYFLVIKKEVVSELSTKWQGFRIDKGLYNYILSNRIYNRLALPEENNHD